MPHVGDSNLMGVAEKRPFQMTPLRLLLFTAVPRNRGVLGNQFVSLGLIFHESPERLGPFWNPSCMQNTVSSIVQ